jgi:SSS family solute:Na+ symporter
MTIYVGIPALATNLLFAVIVTLIAKKAKVFNGTDQTDPSDYHVDEDSPRVKPIAAH